MNYVLAILIYLALMLAPAQQTSAVRYVAPYGTASAPGSADEPQSLAAALQQGGELLLLPGTYSGAWTVSVAGTVLQSAPGTRARLDGSLTIRGAGSTVRGLEIADWSWSNRAQPTPAQQARTVSVQAPNVTIADCWIHDLAGGIYAFNGSGGATAGLVVRRNLIYNIGYGAQLGRGNGHAVYVQNDSAGEKHVTENVILNGYAFGMHAYGSSGPSAQLERMHLTGNVQGWNRMLIGGGRPLRDVRIEGNRLYAAQLQVGYVSQANEDVTVAGNWIGNARLQVQWILTPTVRLNRIVAPADDTVVSLYPVQSSGAWDANSYWRTTPNGTQPFGVEGEGFYSLAEWRSKTGWDGTSTLTPTLPAENWIDVQVWAPHRGRVAVYNWTNAQTVTLDLAPMGLTAGAQYQLINAQNPVETLVFVAGQPVAVPMTGWTVATPYGATAPLRAWDSRFVVFLVEPA